MLLQLLIRGINFDSYLVTQNRSSMFVPDTKHQRLLQCPLNLVTIDGIFAQLHRHGKTACFAPTSCGQIYQYAVPDALTVILRVICAAYFLL